MVVRFIKKEKPMLKDEKSNNIGFLMMHFGVKKLGEDVDRERIIRYYTNNN